MSKPDLSLFEEMDAVADEMLRGRDLVDELGALVVEFRLVQKRRQPDLCTDEWRTLFHEWAECYDGRQRIQSAERDKRLADLLLGQDLLFQWRDRLPPGAERDMVSARIYASSLELANIVAPEREPPPAVATWVGDKPTE